MTPEPIAEHLDNAPICRLCRYSLKAVNGCEFCLPVKAHLIWPVMHELEATETAKALSQQSARLLKKQLRKLNEHVDKAEYDEKVTGELIKLSNAITKLTDQVRKLEDRENERTAALTFEEQTTLIANQFFANLPEQHQKTMLNKLNDILQSTSTPYMLTGEIVDVK